eukprot:s3541_g1.t1
MHRMLVVAVSLCLASRAGAARSDANLVHLHQAGHEEKYDKDLTNQDETHGQGKATQEDPDVFANAVCCRCHMANGMKLPDTTKLNPPCHSGCYEVPSSNCGSWGR